jgi:hypothetical protein
MPKITAKAAPARSRKPKAEVQQEFETLVREVDDAREAADLKRAEAEKQREAEVRQAVEGVTVESVAARLSGMGFEITRALAGISEQLMQEVNRLQAVRDAVELERAELTRLHKIDVAATALDYLVQDYRAQSEKLEAEIAAARAEWEQESRTAERERKEQEEALRKQRQREIDDYEYKKQLERKKAQDKYDEDMRLLEKKNAERQEALEKKWAEREAALKVREQDLDRLRKEVEEFPAKLRQETERTTADAERAVAARFEQQILVLKKDAETERRVAELQISALQATAARQTDTIAALQKQLDEAKQQVQDIAVKAIEGASGSRALAHVNQIAIEQAKNRPQG